MNEIYKSIKKGLEEALAFSQGKKNGTKIHQVKLHSGLPFEIKIPTKRKIPNTTTLKTFRKTDAGKNLVEYVSLDEMFIDLEK